MNKETNIKAKNNAGSSLLERAGQLYGFDKQFQKMDSPHKDAQHKDVMQKDVSQKDVSHKSVAEIEAKQATPLIAPKIAPAITPASTPASTPEIEPEKITQSAAIEPVKSAVVEQRTASSGKETLRIDRAFLAEHNYIVPGGEVTSVAEEFRIAKRQLLMAARGSKGAPPIENGTRILVCSAHPNEGKTYSSINLALSIASEKDNNVLLVDADFAKPSIMRELGLDETQKRKGLMDALSDPTENVENLILDTDIDGLSILPSGIRTNQDTEYLAAASTARLIDQLSRTDLGRIIIFDSPPALAASPASVLAYHVGQTLVVVHADVTTESALRDAIGLLDGCDNIQLLLNRAKFSPTGRSFGSYYGYGA
ncbi:hypothetical protein LPB140_06225 [Sphingorhabdus lutea]|uniref:non-specific protein-tyrosine kinase n=1 Tax=Sphingorhabdus lutea TaxID=1913578 RepID=A0A1L3JBE7_9SPHN|nr:AAA family ATPase [Sphingorhabdus lutea]APG62452.1 hypothetical protein LPB140_06225 [Sphingorhabdus lutea]